MTTPSPAGAPARTAPRAWLAVLAVAAGTFTVVTTEMLPVGLLTRFAPALEVSEGVAGLTMTLPGLVAAVAAPALTLTTARLDRRLVLCALLALLIVANVLCAVAPVFGVLLIGRLVAGVGIGGFWAVAAGLAVRLVPGRSVGAATSTIFGGIAVASVLGVPAATYLGDLAGWRLAFTAMGVLALAVLAGLLLLVPPLPATGAVRLDAVPALVRDRRVRIGLLVTLLLVTGHFAANTYLRPVLEQLGGIPSGLVGTLLLVYGAAGVLGNFAAGTAASRDVRRTLIALALVLGTAVLLIPVVPALAIALLVVWGLAYGGVSVSVQTWFLTAGHAAPEAGSAIFVSAFNLAIALGALLGGRIADAVTLSGALWTGGALAVLAAVPLLLRPVSPAGDRP
ncbi:MFS transporter [Amycolatopsis samaneae]|uniref:MFS transporter n=1 Tax=Amycolatopsis samaneae TaxID=664691 RepID=A0ABW5GCM7_9PSEU